MPNSPRTQRERREETRSALVAAGRRLFAERGYADVGTGEVAADAEVTRGALYHHFEDKQALFAAVVEAVEADVAARITQQVVDAGAADPLAALQAAVGAWLDISGEREVQRIVLVDATTVLGPEGLREIALQHALGLTEALLSAGMAAGALVEQPVGPLAQILIGALNEAAVLVARAEDAQLAREQASAILLRLIDGLRC